MSWMVPDNAMADPALYRPKPPMVWETHFSEFVLNRVCEQVMIGVDGSQAFKENHLQSVCNDGLDYRPYSHPYLGEQPPEEVETEVCACVQD
jgi:hypothetical protein